MAASTLRRRLSRSPAGSRLGVDRGQTLALRGCLLLLKVNRAAKSQERILLVTARALYTLKPGSWAQTNRVPLAALSGLSMSTFADGFVVVSVNAAACDRDADLVLSSPQKAELVTVLKDAVSRLGRPEPLAISFADKLEFRSGKARGPIDSRGPAPPTHARPLARSSSLGRAPRERDRVSHHQLLRGHVARLQGAGGSAQRGPRPPAGAAGVAGSHPASVGLQRGAPARRHRLTNA